MPQLPGCEASKLLEKFFLLKDPGKCGWRNLIPCQPGNRDYGFRMPFSHFGLGKDILRAIQKAGYVRPTPVQTAAIPKVLQGGNVAVQCYTGSGKVRQWATPEFA